MSLCPLNLPGSCADTDTNGLCETGESHLESSAYEYKFIPTVSQSARQRLAAVLIADIAGYTRLVESDTAGTVAAWQACREGVIEPTIRRFGGQIVKFTGDGFLAEFTAVQDAVVAALTMQSQFADHPLEFRMGINLGDIVDDGQDIHGEGINIAARIEAMAPDGGICITGTVHDAIRNRVDAVFNDLGEHSVKHVSNPVRVWRWPVDAQSAQTPVPISVDTGSRTEAPSIAVMPFTNPNNDPEQADFIDGMTEDLITDLSKISGLFVVARQSSLAYRDRELSPQVIAGELGVRYLLQGKLRRSGTRIRINAQLVDTHSGNEIWADRYDGTLENVFELQDEVSVQVVEALSIKLSPHESANLRRVHTTNLEAFELFVRARATPYPPIPERIASAREMFNHVIELDPEFAGGYAGVSSMMSFVNTWGNNFDADAIDKAIQLAEKACNVDDSFGWGHIALGMAFMTDRKHPESIEAMQRGIAREPNDADSHAMFSLALSAMGDYDAAIAAIDRSLLLNPQFFYGPYLNIRGIAHLLKGDYATAVDSFQENEKRQGPVGPPALGCQAAALLELDRRDEMLQRVEQFRSRFPGFNLTGWVFPRLFRDVEVQERLTSQMRKAGVPS